MLELRENLPVIIEHHPFYESLNKKIIKETQNHFYQENLKNLDGNLSNVRAAQTNDYKISTPSLELVYEWILTLLRPQNKGWTLRVDNAWLAWYRDKEFAVKHYHHPAAYAFVYFVKCPKGSSPLIFSTSGKRIKAEEGKLVIFHGNLLHHVPKNRCNDRIVLAGNVFASLESVRHEEFFNPKIKKYSTTKNDAI